MTIIRRTILFCLALTTSLDGRDALTQEHADETPDIPSSEEEGKLVRDLERFLNNPGILMTYFREEGVRKMEAKLAETPTEDGKIHKFLHAALVESSGEKLDDAFYSQLPLYLHPEDEKDFWSGVVSLARLYRHRSCEKRARALLNVDNTVHIPRISLGIWHQYLVTRYQSVYACPPRP